MKKTRRDLEEAIKEKISPLLEETMEKHWGVTIPKLKADISDKLKQPLLQIYIPLHLSFVQAKKVFRKEFLNRELQFHWGNVSQLAKALELDRRSIHRSIRELNIKVDESRSLRHSPGEYSAVEYLKDAVDKTLKETLEQYKDLIQPQKLEQMYGRFEELSPHIAHSLPHAELTWKEAEEEFERRFLSHALEEHNHSMAAAARAIKLRPETLSRKIRKLGLRP